MTSDAADLRSLHETLDALRREVARLGDRVADMEMVVGTWPAKAPTNQPPIVAESVNEEIIILISGAIAAYLGVRPHIRQISLVGDTFWAQQGRATIQASHTFSIRHD